MKPRPCVRCNQRLTKLATGVCRFCAVKPAAPYGSWRHATPSSDLAAQAMMDVEAGPASEPDGTAFGAVPAQGNPVEVSLLFVRPGLSDDGEYLGCSGCQDEDSSDYCRCYSIQGVRLDVDDALAEWSKLLEARYPGLPSEFRHVALRAIHAHGAFDVANYEPEIDHDYYGDILRDTGFKNADALQITLRSLDRAWANQSADQFVRASLLAEYGRLSPSLERAEYVGLADIAIEALTVANERHFAQVTDGVRPNAHDGTEAVQGVVVRHGDRIVLLDGHHRTAAATKAGAAVGRFFLFDWS